MLPSACQTSDFATHFATVVFIILIFTYSLWVCPGSMLHVAMVTMNAHVLKRAGIIVGLTRDSHHGRLCHRLREKGSFGWIGSHILP